LIVNSLAPKKDFPIFNDDTLVYLDNASTSQKPSKVIEGLKTTYELYNANVHRALYSLGSESTRLYESARENVAKFINAPTSKEIVFTSGTTESINLLAYSLGTTLKENDQILITEMEHHANLVPWQQLAKRTGAKLIFLPITNNGDLDLSDPDKYFTKKTKIISITHMSNVLGTINPINKISKIARQVNAVLIIDGAQSVSHLDVDVQKLDCDFLTFSGHKMLGPTGIGILWGKMGLLKSLPPFMSGGEMIDKVTKSSSTWNIVPYKFEAGTPNYVQAIGLGYAIDYLSKIGMNKVANHEKKLTEYAIKVLKSIPGMKIYGDPKNRGGVLSFNINNVHPHDLSQFLNQDNIAIRVGHHCAQPLLKTLGQTSTARASFYLYNSSKDIDRLFESIESNKKYF